MVRYFRKLLVFDENYILKFTMAITHFNCAQYKSKQKIQFYMQTVAVGMHEPSIFMNIFVVYTEMET